MTVGYCVFGLEPVMRGGVAFSSRGIEENERSIVFAMISRQRHSRGDKRSFRLKRPSIQWMRFTTIKDVPFCSTWSLLWLSPGKKIVKNVKGLEFPDEVPGAACLKRLDHQSNGDLFSRFPRENYRRRRQFGDTLHYLDNFLAALPVQSASRRMKVADFSIIAVVP